MKIFARQAICVIGVLAALVSFPSMSAATDCSFGGVISPPLPDDGGECIASGSIKAKGTLVVSPEATDEFDVEDGMSLRIRHTDSSPGSLIINVDADFDAGGDPSLEETLISDPIVIDADGEIRNNGRLNLVAAEDSIRMRAWNNITLHGDFSNLDAEKVKLESRDGDIIFNAAGVISRASSLDIRAAGDIVAFDSFFSANDGTGKCRFSAGGQFIDGGGNIFNCTVVVNH